MKCDRTSAKTFLLLALAAVGFDCGRAHRLYAVDRAGLIVVVDAASAAELLEHAGDPSSLVHGLVRSSAAEKELRGELLAAGKTGRVTVSVWDGRRIPFVENTVNRIVCKQVTDDVRPSTPPARRCGRSLTPNRWTSGNNTSISPTATR
jgi:hypothetical protein